MHLIDYSIIVAYLIGLLYLGFRRRISDSTSAGELILAGRQLTMPAFALSLVSTWYGGILGVGEYSYRFGLSNWLVFGLPYYLAAALFAVFLAKKARQSEVLTIPERLGQVYDNRTAVLGGIIIYLITVPGAYVLSIGVLCEQILGIPFWVGVIGGSFFSIVYVYLGGFSSVVRTDIFQTICMFLGFVVLFVYLVMQYGGYEFLQAHLPENHLTWHGGRSGWYIATWYVIALMTLAEPAFYQRCYAAKSPTTARNGIFLSIAMWAGFDFLSTSCGLYARALLPNLADPVSSFPALAMHLLPAGILGLFVLGMVTTVQSTVDSYFFISASTFGNDIVGRIKRLNEIELVRFTRIGLILSAIVAVAFVFIFRSVVDIWYAFGSIATPALIAPVFFSLVGKRRPPARIVFWTIIVSGSISLVWYLSQYWNGGDFWFGLAPIFPGLAVSLGVFGMTARK
jgi:SSS family solute:Na+ symporter